MKQTEKINPPCLLQHPRTKRAEGGREVSSSPRALCLCCSSTCDAHDAGSPVTSQPGSQVLPTDPHEASALKPGRLREFRVFLFFLRRSHLDTTFPGPRAAGKAETGTQQRAREKRVISLHAATPLISTSGGRGLSYLRWEA